MGQQSAAQRFWRGAVLQVRHQHQPDPQAGRERGVLSAVGPHRRQDGAGCGYSLVAYHHGGALYNGRVAATIVGTRALSFLAPYDAATDGVRMACRWDPSHGTLL